MESVRSMRLRKTCPKCGAVVHAKRAMPLRVKGGHIAAMAEVKGKEAKLGVEVCEREG